MTGYRCIAFAIAFLGCGVLASNAAEFFRLSDYIPGDLDSIAFDVSADGTTVVGRYNVGDPSQQRGNRAFRWVLGSDPQTLDPSSPQEQLTGSALRVSADGSVVLGESDGVNTPSRYYLWSESTGFTYLDLPDTPVDMTSDAKKVVGGNGASPMFVWTEGSGITSIPRPAGVAAWTVRGISDNGKYVTGSILDDNGLVQGFRWDFDGPLDILPVLGAFEGEMQSQGWDVSDNGIVGAFSTSEDGLASYRWTEQGGASAIGELGPVPYSSNPLDISPDGNIIVGDANNGPGFNGDAFLWVEGIGNRSIEAILERSGYDMSEWQIGAAAVSDNGRVVVGAGVNPDGNSEGWVLILEPSEVPEPSSSMLLALGGIASLALVRRGVRL